MRVDSAGRYWLSVRNHMTHTAAAASSYPVALTLFSATLKHEEHEDDNWNHDVRKALRGPAATNYAQHQHWFQVTEG